MKIKYSILIALLLSAISLHAHAQQNGGGLLYANTFAQWTIPQGNNGAFSWTPGSACSVNSQGNNFVAFKVGTPVKLQDIQNPALDETITPSAVNISASNCAISARTVNQHYSFNLSSATFGLQEAINYAISQGQTYVVVLTPAWANMGGTTDMITAALGSVNVSILDQRTSLCTSYEWNGSAYAGRPCGGGGSPDGPHTIQGADAVGSSFVSTDELIGNTFDNPADAVSAACSSSSKSVYFPAGIYQVTATIPGCTGLHIRCASTDVFGNGGTIFQLQPGAAIWGFANPNADASSGTPNENVNQGMRIENCKFDISQDSAALGAMRIKGFRFNSFSHLAIMTDNNPNPAITCDGSNSGFNDGAYDNLFDGLNIWENGSDSTSVAESLINGCNQNTFIGGIINRFGTDIHIANGNGNIWVGTDGEGWQQTALQLDNSGSVNGNSFIRFRTEYGALSWVANQNVFLGETIIDSNGNREKVTTAGTNGATAPTWPTTIGATTTSGTATYILDHILPTDVIATGSVNNTIDVTCSFENCIEDTTGFNNYPQATTYGSQAILNNSQSFIGWSNPFRTLNGYLNTTPGDTTNLWSGPCADGYKFGCLAVNGADGGEIQASRAFVLCNSSSSVGCTGYSRIFTTAAEPQDITIPDNGGQPGTVLLQGQNILITPKQQATAPTPNYGSLQLQWQGSYYTGSLIFAEYLSDITGASYTGTEGQTCNVTFNNGSTATATVALSDTNTIAPNTVMTITSQGAGATSAPTIGTLSNGTATCSGQVNLTHVVLGAGTAGFTSLLGPSTGTGSNPQVFFAIQPFGTTATNNQIQLQKSDVLIYNPNAATSSQNQIPNKLQFLGHCWNGTSSQNEDWTFTPTLGTMTVSYGGCGAGTFNVQGNLQVNGSTLQAVYSGQFTTTTATSESVALNGCTSSSHPWVQPANSIAAAMTGVFVNAPATNGFTLNHPATAGGLFNVFCTAN